jgi:beta-glucanase (GH16 family)
MRTFRPIRIPALAAFAALVGTAQCLASPEPPRPGLSLAFSDEFEGDALSGAWATAFRTGERTHGDEAQVYLDAGDPAGTLRVGDGRLTITARKAAAPPLPDRPDIGYVSGLVSSHPSGSILYGYVEARIRIPAGRGLWPAFWLFQDPGAPGYGEIDVMEALCHDTTRIYSTLHAGPAWKGRKILQVEPRAAESGAASFADGFHVYAVDWGPERVRTLVDGRETGSWPTEDALKVPMHMMLNLAVGGEWAGPPDDPMALPARMEVDWVRVWRDPEPAASKP